MNDISERLNLISKRIDVDFGLQVCGGKQDLYFRMLMLFVENYHDFVPTFSQTFVSDSYEAAMPLAHSLKGVAGTLGATCLQEKAATLELACIDRVEENKIKAFLSELETELAPLINELLELKE